MASKDKSVRENQLAYWQAKLSERKRLLQADNVSAEEMKKDPAVKRILAKIREVNSRIASIIVLEKKKESLEAHKKQKEAAEKKPKEKQDKEDKEEDAAESKTQQKKKAKLEKKKAQKTSEE